MESYQYVMALIAFMAGAAVGAFFLVVIGVHKGDRARRLSDGPATALDAYTCRALGLAGRR